MVQFVQRNCITHPNTHGVTPSALDTEYWHAMRNFLSSFIDAQARRIGASLKEGQTARMLDVAPQKYQGAQPFAAHSQGRIVVHSLDINPASGATYIADITQNNRHIIPDRSFDLVLITEVIEHTQQPFAVEQELSRILKAGGLALVSVPCNFRIHGPLPDNWRFTEHGLRALFPANRWEIEEMTALEAEDRPLFPIDYAMVLRKK